MGTCWLPSISRIIRFSNCPKPAGIEPLKILYWSCKNSRFFSCPKLSGIVKVRWLYARSSWERFISWPKVEGTVLIKRLEERYNSSSPVRFTRESGSEPRKLKSSKSRDRIVLPLLEFSHMTPYHTGIAQGSVPDEKFQYDVNGVSDCHPWTKTDHEVHCTVQPTDCW